MSELIERQHPLRSFFAYRGTDAVIDAGVTVRVQPALDFNNLRGDVEDRKFCSVTEAALGHALPIVPNTWTGDAQRVYWLGPDEWLIVSPAGSGENLVSQFDGLNAAVNSQSGGLLQLSVSGGAARDLLAKGCTLDLHADAFGVGQCAQSGLAKASVLLAALDASPQFGLIVRRSFAEYLALWLDDAAAEFGICFAVDD